MKNRIFTLLVLLNLAVIPKLFSQNVSINSDGSLPDTSAMLDVSSTTKGFLLPRMTSTDRDAIFLPATGLTIFNMTILAYQVNTGSAAVPFWSTLGVTIGTAPIGPAGGDLTGSYPDPTLAASGVTAATYGNNTGTSYPYITVDAKGRIISATSQNITFPAAIESLNGLTVATQTFSTPGTTGLAPSWSSAGSAHTLNIPLASATSVTAGLLSNADYVTFNNKASTTGTWSTTGNTGTSYLTNFIGTTDNNSFRIKANNTQGLLVDSLGNVAIGGNPVFTTLPAREKFLVDAGTTTSINAISAKGTIDSYFQLNIQNKSATPGASSDIVATADNGDESNAYVDLGINSSAYNTAAYNLGGFNDSYLFSVASASNVGGNFSFGTASSGKVIKFHTGGTVAANERMRIDAAGNVGIANTAPTQKLDVTGNLRVSGAYMPNNLPGTSGSILVSSGANVAPTWQDGSSFLSANSWILAGNSVTAEKKFGTTSNFAVPFITNNVERMRISNIGDVAIGVNTFNATNPEQLLVDAGATGNTSFQNVIVGKGNTNSYAQLNIQNLSAGIGASSDVVATNNLGTEINLINFVDMGINSSGNTSTGVLGGPNTGYIYSTGSDFSIGNSTSGKNLMLFTSASGTSNEALRIDSSGKIGIGNTSPLEKLDVTGNVKFSGALMPNNLPGIGGYILTSAGAGAAPVWTAPASNVTSVTGTTNRITSSGGTTPAIDIAATYVGQASITTLGTVATGTWNATAITPTKGGTGATTYAKGDILYASAANVLSKLTVGSTGNLLTVAAGVPSWSAGYTFTAGGDVTGSSSGSFALNPTLTIGDNKVTNNMLQGNIDLSTKVAGNLDITHLDGGTNASTSTFWRGDGTWSTTTPITTQTADYTALISDYTIVADNTAAMVVNLPTAVGIAGTIYIVKKISGPALDVTVTSNGGETIDGSNTQTLVTKYSKVTVQSDGANWIIL